MSQDDRQEGCFRAYLKPGQELPEPPSEQELQQAIREGRIAAVINGKRVELPEHQAADEKKPSRQSLEGFWVICCSTDSA